LKNDKVYPDVKNTIRYSNVGISPETSVSSASGGWLNENMSGYLNLLPTDPLNTDEYRYIYIRDDLSYELNVKLEYFTDTMVNDTGNNNNLYEVGDNLNLL